MTLSQNADIAVNVDSWKTSIGGLKDAQKAIQDYGNEMKAIVRSVLAEQGFGGEIADTIVNNYDETVLKEHLKLNDSMEEQVGLQERSVTEFEETADAAMRIAKNF